MEYLPDNELVTRCQKELPYQTSAFEVLVNRYKQKVFAKALSILKNHEEARDLSQEVFLRVFNGLPSFRSEASFSTWLYTITVNTSLNHLEKLQRRPWWMIGESIDDLQQTQEEELGIFLLVSQSAEQQDIRQAITLTLDRLNPKEKEVLILRYFDELEYQAIADRFKIGLSAVKMRLKRARQAFKLQYENLMQESHDG